MAVTKWLKPSDSVSRIGDSARVKAATRVNATQASKVNLWMPTRPSVGSISTSRLAKFDRGESWMGSRFAVILAAGVMAIYG
jgi:hypothetical protein